MTPISHDSPGHDLAFEDSNDRARPFMNEATLLSLTTSNYASRLYAARPELAAQVAQWSKTPIRREWVEERLNALCSTCTANNRLDEAALKTALRRLRGEVLCTVMERDLAGLADVAEVTGAMTDLAEVCIQRALSVLSAELESLYGEPRGPEGERLSLGVVGMGKLGGRELNVSSDIDLIFVYEDDGETAGAQGSPIATQDFFTRLGKRLIAALAEV